VFGTSGTDNGVHGESGVSNRAGVWGNNRGDGAGVIGSSAGGDGVHGQSSREGRSGVWGDNTGGGVGVAGSTTSSADADGSGDNIRAAVWGDNKGTGPGVLGRSHGVRDDGTGGDGVRGESDHGIGVRGRGVFAVLGEQSDDPTTLRPGAGVMGLCGGLSIAVLGQNTGGGKGIHGVGGIGVLGQADGVSDGLWGDPALNQALDAGVYGVGTVYAVYGLGFGPQSIGGTFAGGRAQIKLERALTVGPPADGDHGRGELFLDANADLWLCKADGTPGTWKLIG
jgi:hypothetical protein